MTRFLALASTLTVLLIVGGCQRAEDEAASGGDDNGAWIAEYLRTEFIATRAGDDRILLLRRGERHNRSFQWRVDEHLELPGKHRAKDLVLEAVGTDAATIAWRIGQDGAVHQSGTLSLPLRGAVNTE